MQFEFFKNFPVSVIGNVWQFLPYKDAQNVRQTCSSLNDSYHVNRSVIQGPTCDAFITYEYKVGYQVYINNRHVKNQHCLVNLNCGKLKIQTGEVNIPKLQKIIKTWKINVLQFNGYHIDDETLQFFDSISKTIEINTKILYATKIPTSKIKSLEVREPLLFYTLMAALQNNRNLKKLRISTTFASIPIIKEITQNKWPNLECWEIDVKNWQFLDLDLTDASDQLRVQYNQGTFKIERLL